MAWCLMAPSHCLNQCTKPRYQTIIWTNSDLLSTTPLRTNFGESWIEMIFIQSNRFGNVCKMAAILFRPHGINVWIHSICFFFQDPAQSLPRKLCCRFSPCPAPHWTLMMSPHPRRPAPLTPWCSLRSTPPTVPCCIAHLSPTSTHWGAPLVPSRATTRATCVALWVCSWTVTAIILIQMIKTRRIYGRGRPVKVLTCWTEYWMKMTG